MSIEMPQVEYFFISQTTTRFSPQTIKMPVLDTAGNSARQPRQSKAVDI
jgi:hypothetical protein